MIVTSTFPPIYDPNLFKNDPPAPYGYRGVQFPISRLDEVLWVDSSQSKRLIICARPVIVSVLEIEESTASPRDEMADPGLPKIPPQPLKFIAVGPKYRIWTSIWRDRIEIDFRPLSQWRTSGLTRFPASWKNLLDDLRDVALEAAA